VHAGECGCTCSEELDLFDCDQRGGLDPGEIGVTGRERKRKKKKSTGEDEKQKMWKRRKEIEVIPPFHVRGLTAVSPIHSQGKNCAISEASVTGGRT